MFDQLQNICIHMNLFLCYFYYCKLFILIKFIFIMQWYFFPITVKQKNLIVLLEKYIFVLYYMAIGAANVYLMKKKLLYCNKNVSTYNLPFVL